MPRGRRRQGAGRAAIQQVRERRQAREEEGTPEDARDVTAVSAEGAKHEGDRADALLGVRGDEGNEFAGAEEEEAEGVEEEDRAAEAAERRGAAVFRWGRASF